jgi:hypothetical protein
VNAKSSNLQQFSNEFGCLTFSVTITAHRAIRITKRGATRVEAIQYARAEINGVVIRPTTVGTPIIDSSIKWMKNENIERGMK